MACHSRSNGVVWQQMVLTAEKLERERDRIIVTRSDAENDRHSTSLSWKRVGASSREFSEASKVQTIRNAQSGS